MTDFLGELGENKCKSWCSQSGLAASPSSPDRLGWDLLVEWEPHQSSTPLDSSNNLPKALVQVKSSRAEKRARSVSAKLSSWKMLVDTELPAFVLHLRYNDSSLLQEARLLHIGQLEIGKILKRTRQAERDKRRLNDIRLSLSLEDAENLNIDGTNFREKLETTIGPSMFGYIETKREAVTTVGLDNHPIKGNFTLRGTPDEISDEFLGIGSSVEVVSGTFSKERFGIRLESDTEEIPSGRMRISPSPLASCTAFVLDVEGSTKCQTELNVFAFPYGRVDKGEIKIRIANNFVEIVSKLNSNSVEWNIVIPSDKMLALQEYHEMISFIFHCCQPGASIEIDSGIGARMTINSLNNEGHAKAWKPLRDFVELIHNAFSRRPGLPSPKLTFVELEECLKQHFDEFKLLTEYAPVFSTELTADIVKEPIKEDAVLFYPLTIEFPKFTYGAIARYSNAKIEAKDNFLRVEFSDSDIEFEEIRTDINNDILSDLSSRASSFFDKEKDDAKYVIAV